MLTSPVQVQDDIEQYLALYEQMLKIRTFEDQVNTLYQTGLMPGLAHQYSGQEAVAVGVCDALERTDYITSTHRGHGHCLAKGAQVDRMFAELLGKEAGYCSGKGGSMHIADPESGNLGANAIVGGRVHLLQGDRRRRSVGPPTCVRDPLRGGGWAGCARSGRSRTAPGRRLPCR